MASIGSDALGVLSGKHSESGYPGERGGYWFELGSQSEASNQYSEPVVSIEHRTIADWGKVSARAQIDNLGQMSDDVYGNPGNQGFKTWFTTYYDLGDSGLQLWYDAFSVSNMAIFEMTNFLGGAYKYKVGGVHLKAAFGTNYAFGHAGTAKNRVQGFESLASRLEAFWPVNKELVTFAAIESHWNRTEEYQNVYMYRESGHHAFAAAKYMLTPKLDVTGSYHYFRSWGGYNNDGNSVSVTLGYYF